MKNSHDCFCDEKFSRHTPNMQGHAPTKVALRYKFAIIFLDKYNPHPYHGLKDHIHVTQANTGYNLPAVADDTCVQRCKIHPDITPT